MSSRNCGGPRARGDLKSLVMSDEALRLDAVKPEGEGDVLTRCSIGCGNSMLDCMRLCNG